MALSYLKFIVGDPPEGCELGIMWHEHELGDYPSIGVYWDFPQQEAPWDYIRKCEMILERFNDAVSWSEIEPNQVNAESEDIEEDDTD